MAIERFLVAGKHFVAGDLFLDEPVVRFVAIERIDHVIAIAPGVRAVGIEFEAVGIGVAHHIQPFQRPALAVVRRGEQAVDNFFVCVGRFVLDEGVDFGRSGRQADEIEGNAADEVDPIGGFGGPQFLGLEDAQDECIDRRPHPGIGNFGHRREVGFLKSPILSARPDELGFFVERGLIRGERGRESSPQ